MEIHRLTESFANARKPKLRRHKSPLQRNPSRRRHSPTRQDQRSRSPSMSYIKKVIVPEIENLSMSINALYSRLDGGNKPSQSHLEMRLDELEAENSLLRSSL